MDIKITRWLGGIVIPLFYLLVWVSMVRFSEIILERQFFNNDLFLILSFLILFLGILTRSTSWQIGHTHFGIKGDTLGRFLSFHKDSDDSYWFDAYIDNPEKIPELQDLITKLTKRITSET